MLPVWEDRAAAQPATAFMSSMRPMTLPRFAGASPVLASSPETLIKVISGYFSATLSVSSSNSSEVVRMSVAPSATMSSTTPSSVASGLSAGLSDSKMIASEPGMLSITYCAPSAWAWLQPWSFFGPTRTTPKVIGPASAAGASASSAGAAVSPPKTLIVPAAMPAAASSAAALAASGIW